MPEPLPVLVLAATEVEAADLRRRAGATVLDENGPIRLAAGTLGGQTIHLARSGVGKANAAFAAGWLAARAGYRALVNVGCAGALPGSGLSPGDVVIALEEVLADEGAATPEGFLDLEALGLASLEGAGPVWNRIPLRLPCPLGPGDLQELEAALGFPLRSGALSTVSTGSGTDRAAAEARARWNTLAESMEGGAIALAALRAGLPFLEVRGISNRAGDRDRASWDVPLAARRAAEAVARIIEGAGSWPETAPPAADRR